MCDYSLENVASRAARVGEKLVSTQFVNSLTPRFRGDRRAGSCRVLASWHRAGL